MQPLRTGSKQLIREINQALVLNAVRTAGAISRSDVARVTGLGLPTVSGIAGELVDAGLLHEADAVEQGIGRPPVLLSLNAGAGYAVGIKVTEHRLIAVLTDLSATVVARRSRQLRGRSVETLVSSIAECVAALAPATRGAPLRGVGVGLAGVIDRDRGVVRHGTYSHWTALPLGERLEERLGVPVVVDNDVNGLVAAQRWFGRGRGVSDFATVSLGRGIGLGMVLDSRLYRGAGGGAGEFGHIKVVANPVTEPANAAAADVAAGRPCACGGRGCLETVASEPAILAAAAERVGTALTIDELLARAAAGDDAVLEIYRHAGATLGTAIGNLVNVLNVNLVILAGEGTRGIPYLHESLTTAMAAATYDGLLDDVELVVEPWDDEAWARGSASLLLGELFEPALRSGTDHRLRITADRS